MRTSCFLPCFLTAMIIGVIGCSRDATPGKDDPKSVPKTDDVVKKDKGPEPKTSLADLQKLIDGIPKDSQPRADKDGAIERSKADAWLKANAVGTKIEITGDFSLVNVHASGEKHYNVFVAMGTSAKKVKNEVVAGVDPNEPSWGCIPGTIRAGGVSWEVWLAAAWGADDERIKRPAYGLAWWGLNESAATWLRDLKGTRGTVRGVMSAARFATHYPLIGETESRPNFQVGLTDVTINGIDPRKKGEQTVLQPAKEEKPPGEVAGKDSLVGTWIRDIRDKNKDIWIFRKDGTAVNSLGYAQTWTQRGDQITLRFSDGSVSTWTLKGNRLKSEGTDDYVRKEADEQTVFQENPRGDVVGTWKREKKDTKIFRKDGTYVSSLGGGGIWTQRGDQITISFSDVERATWTLKGDRLIRKGWDDYVRQKP